MTKTKRGRAQRGISLFLGTLSLIFIVPMIGLVIDVGILYSAKSRLQAAVDGASLAAARALNLGQTTAAQATTAKQNAVNWFYANFPSGNWSTTNTIMNSSTVVVQDDPNNANLRDVNVTATTTVPTWFMRWFNLTSTTITAQGFASRRDVVMMMIMDRSGSMNSNNGCANMRAAAKDFTGQFAAGRDHIGMVEFGDTSWVDTDPTTNFQSVLGYSNASGSAAGLIDTISCGDNTGTAQALALGYNELYKTNLPGAFNILLFFTDGIPNSLTLNFTKGGSNSSLMLPGAVGAYAGNCKDSTGKTIRSGGSFVNHPPSWTPGWTMPSGSFFSSIPAGPIGVIASDDPSSSGSYGVRFYKGTSQGNTGHGTITSATAPGCEYTNASAVAPGLGGEENYVDDFQLLPPEDAWGNNLVDSSYNPLTTDANGNVVLNNNPDTGTPLNGNNLTFHLAARNAANAAAITARTNATIPATIFGVGLGGTSQAPPGYDFMQRITNDPNGDLYNSPPLYLPCSQVATCAHYANQPQGVFIFSSDPTQLEHVFVTMASQILRLSK